MKFFSKIKTFFQLAENIYQKIITICLYALVFLVPIFILPLTQDYLEIGKTILFYFLVAVLSITCLLQIIVKKQYTKVKSKVNWLILGFVLLSLLSTIFSLNWRVSLFGILGYYNDSLITTILLAALYFVVVYSMNSRFDFLKLFKILLASSALVALFSLLQIFGFHILTPVSTHVPNFNLVANSISVLAIYLALTVPIAFCLLLHYRKKLPRILLSLLAFFCLAVLFLLDVEVGWLALVIGLFLFLIFVAWRSREIPTFWVILPTVLIVLAILFIFINFNFFDVEQDIVLGQNNSWQITSQVLRSRFFLGSGPETFHYDLALHRPVSFNQHPFWNLSFVKANSQWGQFLATQGALNLLVILAISALFLFKGFKKVFTEKFSADWVIDVTIIIVWFSLWLMGFVYSFNIVLSLLFWLFLGLGAVRFLAVSRQEVTLTKEKPKNLGAALGLGIWSVLVIFVCVYAIRFYLAEYDIQRAEQSVTNLEDIKTVENYFSKAIQLNPFSSDYYFNLAESYLVEAGLKVKKGETDIDDLIKQAAAAINQGVILDNKSVRAILKKSITYRDFRGYVTDTEKIVFTNLELAKQKSPLDPLIYFESGRSYLLYVQDWLGKEDKQDNVKDYLTKAETDLLKAVELKNNLVEAHYLLAQSYDWRGQTATAEEKAALRQKIVTELETILLYNPDNQEVKDYLDQIQKETS